MNSRLLLALALLVSPLTLHSQTNQPPAGASAEPSSPEQQIRKLEQDWADAVKRRDVEKLDQMQASDYVFTGPGGVVWSKQRALETIKSGDLEIDSFTFSDVKVRVYGDAAVVTLQVNWNARFRGLDISGPQRMTDVFIKQGGRWQCVASQSTPINQP
jgi:ketosteroid isomerase-like protein